MFAFLFVWLLVCRFARSVGLLCVCCLDSPLWCVCARSGIRLVSCLCLVLMCSFACSCVCLFACSVGSLLVCLFVCVCCLFVRVVCLCDIVLMCLFGRLFVW